MSCLDRIAPERIHNRRREFPRTNALLEHDIQLGIRPALGLGESEISPHETEGAHAGPEEGGFGTPVPRRGVDHARRDDVVEDADDVVQIAGQNNRLAAQTGGGDFGDEAVADGADSEVVGEGVDYEHGADYPRSGGVVSRGEGDETDDEQDDVEGGKTGDVQSSPAETGHEEPGGDGSHSAERVLAHGEVERVSGIEAGLFVELDGVAHEARAAQGLDHPDHGRDLGAAEIGFLQAVEIAGAHSNRLFEFVGVDHHGDGLGGVEFIIASAGEAAEGLFGLLEAALADEPPWGFGGEQDADQEGKGPHPLQSEGNAVAPLAGVVEHASEDAGADELAEDPAEVDVGG